MRKKQKKQLKLPLVIAAILSAVAVASLTTWFINKSTPAAPNTHPTIPEGGVNYNPPTQEEKQQTDQNKQQLAEKDDQPTPTGNITVTLTYAGIYDNNIEAAGYVQGIFEDGGTCKYILSLGSQQITRESKGLTDARYTTCPPVRIPRAELQPGTWKVALHYSSASGSGTSNEQTVTIQ